jgi:hypothetical protein
MSVTLDWVGACTGWKQARVLAARQSVRSWGIATCDDILMQQDLDSIVACVLLADSVRSLVSLGIPKSKLLAKLRDSDTDNFWAAWAEICALQQLSEGSGHRLPLCYEPRKTKGRHFDYRLGSSAVGVSLAVEFKALGLSMAEMRFAARWRPLLDQVVPSRGAITHFAGLDDPFLVPARQERRRLLREAHRLAAQSAATVREASCTAVVAYETEETYLKRLRCRIHEALEQLAGDEPCLAAIHWSNGARSGDVQAMLQSLDLPEHLCGVVLLGAVMALPFPGVHRYAIWHFRRGFQVPGLDTSNPRVVCLTDSPDKAFCEALLSQLDQSASVRLSRFSAPGPQGESIELLRRDGSRRLDPFNFIFTSDPEGIRNLSAASPP